MDLVLETIRPSSSSFSTRLSNTLSGAIRFRHPKSAVHHCRLCTSSILVSESKHYLWGSHYNAYGHLGHSLTIVGLEVRRNGSRNLLVFDPMFKPSPGIYRLIGTQFRAGNPEKLLKAYRRGEAYLKYTSYETLQ